LRALAEAPSATTEIVLVYAKGLFRFLIKTTETIKSSIREQLKALAVSYGQHPEIPMYYYAAYALEYAGIDQKPEPNEMQEAIRFLKKFIEAFPQHNYSNAIQQLLAALKEKGYDLKGA
jgi:outer membrane protein assembly factor BamD (BamD/ComL family)